MVGKISFRGGHKMRNFLVSLKAESLVARPNPGDSAGVSRWSRRYGLPMAHLAAHLIHVTWHAPGLSVVRAIVAASAGPLMLMVAVALSSPATVDRSSIHERQLT